VTLRAVLRSLIAALVLVAAPTALSAQPETTDRDDVVSVAQSDPEMNAAIAEAKRTLPEFLKVVAKPPPGVSAITFKYPLGGWEHIWVTDVQQRGGKLIGRLDNEPLQKEYRLGQEVEVPLSQVSDWAYLGADGVMRGHRTTRVILGRIPPDEAAQIREAFGWSE
jgi:uncharacterized protein YegJ (DUF2314 family)